MISRTLFPTYRWPSLLPLTLLLIGADLQAQQPSVRTTASVPGRYIEEVIVSATRRDENSQQVGISLTALGREQLQRSVARSLPDLADSLPNVELFDDYGGHGMPVWVIRGVGLQDFNANNTPTAAVYVDEVYQSSSVQGGSGLFDTGRGEILKGPQGGLYGRNTSGGVVRQLTTRANLQQQEGYFNLGVGSWDERVLEGAANQPLSDTLAVRIAGRVNRSHDAWQTSLPAGQKHGEKDLWDLRNWWLLEISERSRLEVKLYAGENNSELPLARSVGLYEPDADFCAAALAGQRDDLHCLNYAGLVAALTGSAASPSPSVQKRDGSTSLSSTLNRLDNSHAGATALFTADTRWTALGSPQLQTVSNVERFDYGLAFDYDGSAAELGHQITASAIRSASQELRLVSTASGPLGWQAGTVLSREEFVEDRQFRLQDNVPVGLVHGQLDYEQITRTRAAYAQADYAWSERVSLNGALRYTKEWKTYRDGSVRAPAFPAPYDVVVSDLNGDYALGSRWSGSLGLNWQHTDDTLLYASVSQGFKAGGFFGGFIFDRAEFAPYKEDTVLAYETGIKTQVLDDRLRLNAAVFHYDYRDVQGFANVATGPAGGGTSIVLERLTTLGDGTHSGVDLDVLWLPVENWSVQAALGYLDARIDSGAGTTLNILKQEVSTAGERPYAPHWSGSLTLGNTLPVSSRFVMQSELSWHYRSEFSGTLSSAVDKAMSTLDGYGLLDGTVTLGTVDGRWSISLWGRNLLDKVYSPRKVYDSLGSYVDIMGQPRSLGLQARYHW